MTTKLNLLFTILLLALRLSHSRLTRPESLSYSDQLKNNKNDKGYGSEDYFGPPASGMLGLGEGNGGSYSGGYSVAVPKPPKYWSRIVRPTVVCKEKGHCYNKKLTCPAKCFKLFSRSGKGYGGGDGGGGGCTMDCKEKCMAYC
ncbi:hypothetical protein V5N11_028937 [Cardamine amara subsp. amara]|uniref:Uncharacterized protein n=1 Tax=Cardamine amara subsp. amara TaxID=228776 RepID=A0ABD1BJ26_CARAN